jgi:cellulose synthase/poly-beta-1,6-N-acetylglucosamine synthase-like glycosyltransferase
VDRIAREAQRSQRPVQADYVLKAPPDPRGLTVVSALAFIVKNRVRPRGLHALGLPCLLTGTGMAFPWQVIRKAKATESHLVEDMVMGLDLARLGHAPLLCPEARVTSELPDKAKAAHSQRRRWEHGHLGTMLDQCPGLLVQGVWRLQPALIALALDLSVPPLSLLVLSVGSFAMLTLGFMVAGGSPLPAVVALSSLGLVAAAVLSGWAAYGRQAIPARALWSIPGYVLWKIPLYFSFLTRGRHRNWERTERAAQSREEK